MRAFGVDWQAFAFGFALSQVILNPIIMLTLGVTEYRVFMFCLSAPTAWLCRPPFDQGPRF